VAYRSGRVPRRAVGAANPTVHSRLRYNRVSLNAARWYWKIALRSWSLTRWRRIALQVLLVLGLLAVLHWYQTRGMAAGPVPDFDGVLLDGTPVSMEDYRGAPVLLQFWATWCPVCGLEQAAVDAIARDHAVLGIAMDAASEADIRAYMKKKDVSYPVLHDPRGRLAALFGIRSVPTSVIVDGKGEIRFVEVGYTTGPGLRLRLWWAGP